MEIFDKRTFGMVLNTVQNAKAEVNLNKTWQRLHDELGVGHKNHNKLILSASDLKTLYELLDASVFKGTDSIPATFNIKALSTATRIETAVQVVNEKWTPQTVRKNLLSIRGIEQVVQFAESCRIPLGGYLALPWQEALQHKHGTVVVIENLEIFLVAEKINWPDDIRKQNPLLVYRGDKESTPTAVKKFLESSRQDYFVFFDYDPAGLMMALKQPGYPSVIVPSMPSDKLVKDKHSKLPAFEKQVNARKFLDKREEPDALSPYINQMLKNQLAVMQERMVAFDMKLDVIKY